MREKKIIPHIKGNPAADGYYMPAEYALHQATVLIWPVRPGSWGKNPWSAREAFLDVIFEIVKGEDVYLLADEMHREEAMQALEARKRRKGYKTVDRTGGSDNVGKCRTDYKVTVLSIDSNDAWARDVAPTFVTNGENIRGVSWRFNAWGGTADGLYASWDKDDALAKELCDQLGCLCYDTGEFVLEGGSIHSDGEGTLLVTETCLLSQGRNPELSMEEIEKKLRSYTGCQKVLWLPFGIYQDETNEHVDNICAFTAPGEVVLGWTENKQDPQYAMSLASLQYLEAQTDAKGRKLKVHKLPIPDVPVCVSEEECKQYEFEEGEDVREPGERLAASYVNFYIANQSVLVPQFGGSNKAGDGRAIRILQSLFQNRSVIGINAKAILAGGGNIHCITQQIPALPR